MLGVSTVEVQRFVLSENHFIICGIKVPDKVTRGCKLVCMIQLAELFVGLVVKTKTVSCVQTHQGTIQFTVRVHGYDHVTS